MASTSNIASAAFSWKDALDLVEALTRVQNHPANSDRDILSFAGMCDSRDELELHLCREEIRVQNIDASAEHEAARRAA